MFADPGISPPSTSNPDEVPSPPSSLPDGFSDPPDDPPTLDPLGFVTSTRVPLTKPPDLLTSDPNEFATLFSDATSSEDGFTASDNPDIVTEEEPLVTSSPGNLTDPVIQATTDTSTETVDGSSSTTIAPVFVSVTESTSIDPLAFFTTTRRPLTKPDKLTTFNPLAFFTTPRPKVTKPANLTSPPTKSTTFNPLAFFTTPRPIHPHLSKPTEKKPIFVTIPSHSQQQNTTFDLLAFFTTKRPHIFPSKKPGYTKLTYFMTPVVPDGGTTVKPITISPFIGNLTAPIVLELLGINTSSVEFPHLTAQHQNPYPFFKLNSTQSPVGGFLPYGDAYDENIPVVTKEILNNLTVLLSNM